MKRMLTLTALLAAAAFSTCALAKPASPEATETKARPGEVVDRELEKEKGGSGLRYSFDIKADNVTYEVGVDAKTGDVLENTADGVQVSKGWRGHESRQRGK